MELEKRPIIRVEIVERLEELTTRQSGMVRLDHNDYPTQMLRIVHQAKPSHYLVVHRTHTSWHKPDGEYITEVNWRIFYIFDAERIFFQEKTTSVQAPMPSLSRRQSRQLCEFVQTSRQTGEPLKQVPVKDVRPATTHELQQLRMMLLGWKVMS